MARAKENKRKAQVDYNLLQSIIFARDISCFNSILTSVTKIVHTPWMSSDIGLTIRHKCVFGELHQDQDRSDSIRARYGSIRSGRTGDQEKDKAHTRKENQIDLNTSQATEERPNRGEYRSHVYVLFQQEDDESERCRNRHGKYRAEIENEEYQRIHDHQRSDENQGDVITIIN